MEDFFTSTEQPEFALILRNVGKRLGNRQALQNISLSIRRGQMHGLLGPNGSGKTTLLRLLAGLLSCDSGTIERFHGPMGEIGYVPQRFCLYDELTVRENLRFQAHMRGSDNSLLEVEQRFDLQQLTTCRAGALSGGQRQRLLIAAALLHGPSLVLFDEPTTALDSLSRNRLWDMLRQEAHRGTTLVLTTHEEIDALQCDTITRLQDGSIT